MNTWHGKKVNPIFKNISHSNFGQSHKKTTQNNSKQLSDIKTFQVSRLCWKYVGKTNYWILNLNSLRIL